MSESPDVLPIFANSLKRHDDSNSTSPRHHTEEPASPRSAAVPPPGAAVPDPGRAHRAGVRVGAVSAQIGAIELHPGRLLLAGVVPVLVETAVVAHCRLVLPETARPKTLLDHPCPDDLGTHAAVLGNGDRLPHAQHAGKPLHPRLHLFLPHPALCDAGHRRRRLGPHDLVQRRAELRVHGTDDRPQHGLLPQFHRFPRVQLCRLRELVPQENAELRQLSDARPVHVVLGVDLPGRDSGDSRFRAGRPAFARKTGLLQGHRAGGAAERRAVQGQRGAGAHRVQRAGGQEHAFGRLPQDVERGQAEKRQAFHLGASGVENCFPGQRGSHQLETAGQGLFARGPGHHSADRLPAGDRFWILLCQVVHGRRAFETVDVRVSGPHSRCCAGAGAGVVLPEGRSRDHSVLPVCDFPAPAELVHVDGPVCVDLRFPHADCRPAHRRHIHDHAEHAVEFGRSVAENYRAQSDRHSHQGPMHACHANGGESV
ncbi:hypothetical protein KL931_004227 [Ogataea haglerorum]|nr:hypothetical protein KL931_004227 [Ogataea haglerorum]